MGKLTLILGGARSGKSSHAQNLALQSGKPVTFIATAQVLDEEMDARIAKHRVERPAAWITLEIPFGLASHADQIRTAVVVVDCLTLLVSNLMMQFATGEVVDEAGFAHAVEGEIEALIKAIQDHGGVWIVTSNEVGLGVVPPYTMGRVYRDQLGWANQRLAREADEVLWMMAGIAVPIHTHRGS